MATAFAFPYVLPLFLGMTFDAQNYKAGVDIFDLKYTSDPDVTIHGDSRSYYKVTNSLKETNEALDISGDIALKLKTAQLSISGSGSYLKNENDYRNRVEVLTILKYRSKTLSLKGNAVHREEWWKMYKPEVLGTHYVYSITYGIDVIASARFIVSNSSDVQKVKGDVRLALGDEGDGNKLEGKLDKLAKDLKGKASLEISFYGTGPLTSVANSIDGLMELILNFKDKIEEEGMSDGFPMHMQLEPIMFLAPESERSKFEFQKNKDLEDWLVEFNDDLDDLRLARFALTSWAKTLPYNLHMTVEQDIGRLLKNITDTLNIFYAVSAELDLTKDHSQIKPALDAYDYDHEGEYRRFSNEVKRTIEENNPKIDRGKVASDTYIQWGKNLCSEEDSILLYDGFAFSSSEEGIGGSAKYGCAPRAIDTGYELPKNNIKSTIGGVRYPKMDKSSNPFKGGPSRLISEEGVPCAKCYAPKFATISMFTASTKCPGTWKQMYSGYLMSARRQNGHTTEYICVDEYPSTPYKMDKEPYSKDTVTLTTVHSSGSLPKDTYVEGDLVRCSVCAVTGNDALF